MISYWIDTLVLKTEGNTYATLLHHPFLFGEIQRSAQEVALVAPPTSYPSLLVCFRSKKDHREGFIPFGLRLVFLLCKTLKKAKQIQKLALGPRLID